MTRTKIAFLVATAFALTSTFHGANSASFNATDALKESAVGANLVQSVYGCHTNCRWGWYQAREWQDLHRMSSQHVVMRFRVALQPEGLPLVALVAPLSYELHA